ncbi:MAG: T9SS type A sorting domain-containing protein [Flavobacteriaceae bacterium]
MKKIIFSFICAALTFSMQAQQAEAGPQNDNQIQNSNRALFDLLFITDIGSGGTVGADGLAGIVYLNGEYWVSAWATDIIHRLSSTGTLLESFVVPGVTGTRSMTTDGTSIYLGTAGLEIFKVDPVTKTVTDTIIVATASTAEARMCSYDPTLDGGNGGFWIGDFASDIASVDMFGFELSVIPAATHGTTIYGGAIDNVSPGGPWLWIHDQNGTAPNRDTVVQINPSTGVPTGVVYDFSADGFAFGATDVLAGGLMISEDVVPGYTSILGLCQCTPSNLMFAVELVENLGVSNNEQTSFVIFPNPANTNVVNIESQFDGEKQVVVYDMLGKKVIDTVVENALDISILAPGVYSVKLTQQGASSVKKLIVK